MLWGSVQRAYFIVQPTSALEFGKANEQTCPQLNEELPSLSEQGIQQLYTPPATPTTLQGADKYSDRALILKRLAKSLLLNFLELVGMMSVNPEQYEEKIQDLRTLFINFHHLLNEYRPHQARESLILMMQDQLDRSRAETEGILRMKAEVEEMLEGLGKLDLVETKVDKGKDMGKSVNGGSREVGEEGKDVWEEVWKVFG